MVEKKAGLVVGIPRALITFDCAPLLRGFLDKLGVQMRFSTPTNNHIIEESLRLAYTDSCFPMKLLHGHTADLLEKGVDYVMIPNAIRMSQKTGEADQRYSCPLVQAAPYLVKSALNLVDKLLDPVIDLSRGDQATTESFAKIAQRLGFSRKEGLTAAREGLAAQRRFEVELVETGKGILAELEADPDKIGVVLLARSYNAQDEGANLGMARELQKLGVIPIPLDFLPLHEVDVSQITDRPYWNYERKLLAAARLISEHPQLYGLFLSNFGCGPNSFILNIVEDIMGGKPLGQIEIDEHAAEAGIITRLEAFVDTIGGYRRSGLQLVGEHEDYFRSVSSSMRSGQIVLIPRMSDHAEVVAAAMRSFGVNASVLPESDERSMALSRDVTNGKECLPFRDTLGVFMRMALDGQLPQNARALMAGSYGPCRLGKYAQEQQKILRDLDIDLEIMTTVSNTAYGDLGLGNKFELLAWQGVLATDFLQKLLWTTRPYERRPGEANELYTTFTTHLIRALETGQPIDDFLKGAAPAFKDVQDTSVPARPLVGINGEIYLRANCFCNQDLVALCEADGLEVEVAPMSEWLKYTTVRNIEDAKINREFGRWLKGEFRKLVQTRYENRIASWGDGVFHREPSTRQVLEASADYLPNRNGSEAVLSIGTGVRQMRDPNFAAVISVMPHGCMPGGTVAAIGKEISSECGKPWVSLTFDGFPDKVNPEIVADLAEQLKHQERANTLLRS